MLATSSDYFRIEKQIGPLLDRLNETTDPAVADLVRLRVGDIRKVEADDGTPVLVVLATSPSRQHTTWKFRVVVTAADLAAVESDPQAGQICDGRPDVLFHLIGDQR